jgi:hypothetical protein
MGVFGCLSGSASAATIVAGTQIGFAPGPTVTDDVGNDWNDFAVSGLVTTIHDLDGVTLDGVSINFAAGGMNDAGENNWDGLSTNGGAAPAEFVDSVTTDLSHSNATVTITGLNTALTYNLYSTSHGGGSGWDASEDVHSVTGDVSYGSSQLNRGASRLGAFHTFLGVSPDVTGTIVFTTSQPSSSNPAFNGLLINAVPEPSSTALLGLGGLALILRRRK